MKNIKMLLAALAVIVVVGAGLAFKVKERSQTEYCTTSSNPSANSCKLFLANGEDNGVSPEVFYETTTTGNCGGITNPGINCQTTKARIGAQN